MPKTKTRTAPLLQTTSAPTNMVQKVTPRSREWLSRQEADDSQKYPADEIDSSSASHGQVDIDDEESEESSLYQGLSSDDEMEEPPPAIQHIVFTKDESLDTSDMEKSKDSRVVEMKEESRDAKEARAGDSESSVDVSKDSEASNDSLFRLLRCDKTLTRIEVNRRLLTDWSAALPISDVMMEIARQSSVKALHLDLENMRVEICQTVMNSVQYTLSVSTLEVSRAHFDGDTANAVGIALARNPKTLQNVTFSKCTFSESGFAILFLGLQHVRRLTHFTLKDIAVGEADSHILGASLPLLSRLQSVQIINAQLSSEGFRHVVENIAQNGTLVELNLSGNKLDIQSITRLTNALQSPGCKVEALTLSGCGLDSTCMDLLCRGIADNKKILSLKLSQNQFGDLGALALVTMFRTNHNLQNLNIEGCGVGSKRISQLRDALRYNNSFLKNMFSTEVSLAILDSVGMMENLKGPLA